MTEPLNHHAALIYVMVTMSAVDRAINDAEFARIGEIVSKLPIFDNFNKDALVKTAQECGEVLSAAARASRRSFACMSSSRCEFVYAWIVVI